MFRVLLAVALLAILAVIGVLLLRPAAHAPHAGAAATATPARAETAPGASPVGLAAPAAGGDATDATDATEAAVAGDATATDERRAPVAGRAFEGSVALPDGVPADEVLEVLVLAERPANSTVRELLDGQRGAPGSDVAHAFFVANPAADGSFEARAPHENLVLAERPANSTVRELLDGQRGAPGSGVARAFFVATAAADGSFEARAPHDAEAVWLLPRGRYLYAEEAVRVDLADEAPVVLAVELGAWLSGRLDLPAGREPRAGSDLELELRPDVSAAMGMGALTFDPPRRRHTEVAVADRTTYHLYGVEPGQAYRLFARSDDFALASSPPFDVGPGDQLVVDLAVAAGATLSGRVVDANGDPVPSAELEVEQDPLAFGSGGVTVRSGTADDDGRFTLDAVAPGRSTLKANRAGYLDASVVLELANGERRDGVELVLDGGARISGRVTWPDGSPVADARVDVGFDMSFLGGMEAFNAARGAEGEALTNGDGEFVVTGLGKGPFTVRVEVERAVVDGDAPGVEAEGDEGPPGAETRPWRARIDAVRPGVEDLVLALAPPVGLAGRVVDDRGEPVTEFNVAARTVTSGMLQGLGAETHDDDFANGDGSFFLDGLRHGDWELTSSAEGHGRPEPLAVTLPREDAEPVTLVLPRAAAVAGFVVDSNGAPVPGATVAQALSLADFGRMTGNPLDLPSTVADEDGAFRIDGLTASDVRLEASAEGYAKSSVVPVEVEPAGLAEGVTLKLRSGGRIVGVIYGDDAKPLAGEMILCQSPMSPADQKWTKSDDRGEFVVDHLPPGNYQVMTLPSQGNVDSGEEGSELGRMLEQLKLTMAEVREGEDTEVVLGGAPVEAIRVTGRVLAADEPVAGVVVTFFEDGGSGMNSLKFTTTNGAGVYKADVPGPGGYLVNVQKVVGTGQQQTVEFFEVVPDTEQHELDLDLPIGAIAGTVTDPEGEPLAGVRVTLGVDGPIANGSLTGGTYSEIMTDDDGHYELFWLRPGSYTVAAGGAYLSGVFGDVGETWGRQVRRGLELGEGQALTGVDFELGAPGGIVGRVLGVDGTPVGGASIFLRDAAGNVVDRISFVQTDGAGRFKYTGLEPGRYQVIARNAEAVTPEPAHVEVEAGADADVTVRLATGTVLIVTLTDGEGEDVRCQLEVTGPDGEQVNGLWSLDDLMSSMQSGGVSSREQRIGPLAPGTYRLVAVAADGSDAKKSVTLDGQPERRIRLRVR